MKKQELAKVTLDGKFTTRGWTSKGVLAKKGLDAKKDKAKIDALKTDKANFAEVNVLDWPIDNLGDRYEKIAMLAGLRQAGYIMDLANITEAAIKNALDGMILPKKMDDDTKAMMVSWRKVIACLKEWHQAGTLAQKSKGLTLDKVAEKLYLHKSCGAATALPATWVNLVANLADKVGKESVSFEEIELD